MQRFLGLMACGLVAACGGTDDGTTGENEAANEANAANGAGACAEIVDQHPLDGANDVYYRTLIEFTISGGTTDDSIEVTQGGAAVAGTMSYENDRVIFTPDAPLEPSTTYDVSLTWCNGTTSLSWSTSDVGAPVGSGVELAGKAYTLDLGSGRFVQPPGVGPLIQGQLTTDILIGVSEVIEDPPSIKMNGALADGTGDQDLCQPSIEFPVAADFSENPYFAVGPDSVELDIEGIVVKIDNLEISGAFAADASSIEGAVLAGFIDTRILLDLVGGTQDGDVCELVAAFGVECESCGSGKGDFCLSVYVDSMAANLAPGVSLQLITQEMIDSNQDCAE